MNIQKTVKSALFGMTLISFIPAITHAQEQNGGPEATSGYSAAVLDGEGFLMAARDPDAPKKADLIGRLMLITMAIQDISDGSLKLDEMLSYTHEDSIPAEAALRGAVRNDKQGSISTIALARRLALNPTILGERMAALGERVGLRGTRITIGRGQNGAPSFEGHSTARDTARLATALMRAHPEKVRIFFSDYTTDSVGTPLALSTDSGCVLVSETTVSGASVKNQKEIVRVASVVHNAPDIEKCLRNASESGIKHMERSRDILIMSKNQK